MTNTELLNNEIQKSGIKYKHIASLLGITYYSLHNKICNKTEFKLSEFRKICVILNLDNNMQKQIFFD